METDLTYHQLLSLVKEAKLSPKKDPGIDAAYYRDFIQVSHNQPPRDLFLYPMPSSTLVNVAKSFALILKALQKLAEHAIFSDTNVLKQLYLNSLDIYAVRSRGKEHLFSFCRIDSIFDGNDYKVLEVNANRPQLFEDLDWMGYYFGKNLKLSIPKVGYQIVKAIKSAYKDLQDKEPENIVLISDYLNFIYKHKEYGTFYHKALKQVFPQSNIIGIQTSSLWKFYESLKLVDNSLVWKGKKIDLIIVQENGRGKNAFFNLQGGVNPQTISKAYRNGFVEISSPPSSAIIGSKLSLNLLQDKSFQEKIGLNTEEKESINLVAQSRLIKKVKTEDFSNKNEVVYKVPYVGHGEGVYLGTDYTETQLKNLLLKELKTSKVIQVQSKISADIQKVINLQTLKETDAIVTLDPFFTYEKSKVSMIPAGYYSRAIEKRYITENSRFNPMSNDPKIMVGCAVGYRTGPLTKT